jgi:predicted PurR-regulated permease PerM
MIDSSHNFTRRVLVAVGITTSAALLLLLLWYAVDVLLLAFAGILLAIFLRGLSDWVSEHTPLSGGWSLAVVTLGLIFFSGYWRVASRAGCCRPN